jgi:ComF family protein
MSLKSWLLDLIFPVECLGCQREGDWLCDACLRQLKFSGQEKAAGVAVPELDQIFIAGDYDDPLLAAALKKFKYNFIAALGQPLSRFLILFWQGQLALPGNSRLTEATLIPIPLSKARRRWRGFNQAEILAQKLSEAFGYSVDEHLQRNQTAQPQASLNADERAVNIKGTFAWIGADLGGRQVILIDDVATTGATLNEAAGVLKAAGAGRVYGLVVAKG